MHYSLLYKTNGATLSCAVNYLLDYSLYRFDAHHVDVAVNYFASGTRCVDYLAVADIDRNVSAVAAVVVAYNITRLDITSWNTDA